MKYVKLEKKENIAVITVSRPQALNALNFETIRDLDEALDALEADKDIYCAVITGEGEKAFVAGADISEMKGMAPAEAREFSALGNKVFRRLELLNKPVIAAVNGYALGGGCELCLSCDIRIAAENAVFGQPEVTLGITPGFGGTQRLARVVGTGRAKELIFTGRSINAQEALRIGLANSVVSRESLMDEALKLAGKIASNAPIAVNFSKIAINRGTQCDMDTAVMYESEVFAQCFTTQDQKDAMTAFAEKRKLEGFNNR